MAFGLQSVLTVSQSVHRRRAPTRCRRLSSYAAAGDKGTPRTPAEAGGAGQSQEEAVSLLVNGVVNLMRHLGMIEDAKFESHIANSKTNSEAKPDNDIAQRRGYNSFDELRLALHEEHRRLVSESRAGRCCERRRTAHVGDLFGDALDEIACR